MDFIKTKRYTRTKIQRILLHILLDIKGIRGFVFPQSAENALCACTGLSEAAPFRYSRRFNGAGKMPRSVLKKAPALLKGTGCGLVLKKQRPICTLWRTPTRFIARRIRISQTPLSFSDPQHKIESNRKSRKRIQISSAFLFYGRDCMKKGALWLGSCALLSPDFCPASLS